MQELANEMDDYWAKKDQPPAPAKEGEEGGEVEEVAKEQWPI